MVWPLVRSLVATEADAASSGYFHVRTAEIDRFAAMLRIDVAVLRQDVRSAADYALNAVAIRREDRKAAADGKRWLRMLLQAERTARQVSLLNADAVVRNTVPQNDHATDHLVRTIIQQAVDFLTNLREVRSQRDYARLPAGGGSDQDRLAAKLIERLARVWQRYTNQPAPGGSSGPFVDFVAAAWSDLGFPEFTNKRGEPQPLVDAIGNRVVKFHRRHNRDQNNQALCPKAPRVGRASSLRYQSGGAHGRDRQEFYRQPRVSSRGGSE